MKALIMEDETGIREGLAREVPWEKYGIDEVFTAVNGEAGFETARRERPDIILADIRMPRLDGISAVKKLRAILPDCSVIFVSAYPEKAYFKEAIHLKAVSFVEKPVNLKEIKKVLEEAVQEQRRVRLQRSEREKAQLYSGRQIVTGLCRGEFLTREESNLALEAAGIYKKDWNLTGAVIIQYKEGRSVKEDVLWNDFCSGDEQQIREAPVKMLSAQKHSDNIVYLVFLRQEKDMEKTLQWFQQKLIGIQNYYILAGPFSGSVKKLQESYYQAVLLENYAFYEPYGTVLCDIPEENGEILAVFDFGQWKAEFSEKLNQSRFDDLGKLLEKYRTEILKSRKIHFIAVQKFYMYLYSEMERYMEQHALLTGEGNRAADREESFGNDGNFTELADRAGEMLDSLKNAAETGENSEVVRIKKYILENYENPWLSIKDIAEAAGKSVSYVCVAFKKETGITLNQYMTEVRMETARRLLEDSRNTIQTVAKKTGYADSSYFARAFKKYTGRSPREYRGE